MPLSLEEVKHIAALAHLELCDEELNRLRVELTNILDHFRRLQEVDTSDIPPTTSALTDSVTLRADEACPSLSNESLMAIAPDKEEGQYKIPPLFD